MDLAVTLLATSIAALISGVLSKYIRSRQEVVHITIRDANGKELKIEGSALTETQIKQIIEVLQAAETKPGSDIESNANTSSAVKHE
jgi:hypothetical protein